MKHWQSIAFLLLAMASTAGADIAPLLSYQGRLTDASGAPVSDGVYTVTFSIYASEGAPSPIWTSGEQPVSVSDGLFTYVLGSNVALPDNIFDNHIRYLGITIGNDPELTPRSQFTTSPYAYRALKADSADVLADPDEYVRSDNGVLVGTLHFDGDNDGSDEGSITVAGYYSRLILNHQDIPTVAVFGDSYGDLVLRHGSDGALRVQLDAILNGGRLRLMDSLGDTRVELNAHQEGGFLGLYDSLGNSRVSMSAVGSDDLAILLPDNAVNSDEIYDEPGVSVEILNDYVSITGTSDLENVGTFQVQTPTSGYLKVTLRYFLRLSGTTGINGAFIQIDSVSGGTLTLPYYNFHYHDAFPSTGDHYESASFSRVFYFENSASRPLYINARLASGATGTVDIGRMHVTVEYFPTSYSGVKSWTQDPSGFENATAVTIADDDGNTTTRYEVDLRELELKVKRARKEEKEAHLKRLEAEQQLERARRESDECQRGHVQ